MDGNKKLSNEEILKIVEEFSKKNSSNAIFEQRLNNSGNNSTLNRIKEIRSELNAYDEKINKLNEIIALGKKLNSERETYKNVGFSDNEIENDKDIIKLKEIIAEKEKEIIEKYGEINDYEKESINILAEKEKLENKYLSLKNNELEKLSLQNKLENEGLTFSEKKSLFVKQIGSNLGLNVSKISKGVSEIKQSFNLLKKVSMDFLDTWGKIDQAAFDFEKHIGGSKANAENLRKSTISLINDQHIGIRYNTSAEELIKLQENYNKSLGRTVMLTNDQLEGMTAIGKFMSPETANELADKLDVFGVDATQAEAYANSIFQESTKKGLVFEKYSKNFLENIKLAQNYTFTNGLKGLQSMAEKATAIRLDMKQVASFADKVSTVEGSINAAASLSVLGGSFAAFSNPMSLMNMGLQDMEGLQDTVVSMLGGIGKWNNEKGMVDVTAFNKQRIKAAAEAMGMDYSSLMDMIQAKGRRNKVSEEMGKYNLNGLSDETKELIKNTAQIDKNGEAYVNINGKKKKLNEITENDKEELSKIGQTDSENIRDIAQELRGFGDVKEGFMKQFENQKASLIETLGIGDIAKKIGIDLGSTNGLLKAILIAITAKDIAKGVGGLINGIFNIFGGKGKGLGGLGSMFGGGGGGFSNMLGGGSSGSSNMFGLGGGGLRGGMPAKSLGHSSNFSKLFRGRDVTRAVGGKGFKNGIRGLGKGFNVAKGSTGAIGGGILAAGVTGYNEFFGENKNRDTTSEKIAKTAGAGGGAWAGAAAGAAIGAFAGPIGAAVGGLIGGIVGAIGGTALGEKVGGLTSSEKAIKELAETNGLGYLKGIKNGAYSTDDIRALIDGNGKVDDYDLSVKLRKNGDFESYIANGSKPKMAKGYIPNKGGVSIAKGRTHSEGGILTNIDGGLAEIENNEAVISSDKTRQYLPELLAINNGTLPKYNNLIPKFESGKVPTVEISPNSKAFSAIKVNNGSNSNVSNVKSETKHTFEPLNININGTLNLNANGIQNKIDIKTLLNNPQFKNEITKLVIKEISTVNKKGYSKEENFQIGFSM